MHVCYHLSKQFDFVYICVCMENITSQNQIICKQSWRRHRLITLTDVFRSLRKNSSLTKKTIKIRMCSKLAQSWIRDVLFQRNSFHNNQWVKFYVFESYSYIQPVLIICKVQTDENNKKCFPCVSNLIRRPALNFQYHVDFSIDWKRILLQPARIYWKFFELFPTLIRIQLKNSPVCLRILHFL